MCPGATELTRMPRGPNSVARLCAMASSAALVSLYGPIRRWENRTTIELTSTTEPRLAASTSVNSRISRNAVTTFASKPSRTASRSTAVRSLIGGMASALYTSASTLPNPSTATSATYPAAPASVRSIGTTTARRPSALTSLATSSSRDAVRAASTTSAPSRALARAIDRPNPDPTPAITTTLSRSIISPDTLSASRRAPSAEHPFRHRGLARRDPRPPLLRRHPRLFVVRQPPGQVGARHHLDLRPVRGRELAGQPLPADLHVAAAVPGPLQPVDQARVPLADHEPDHPVRVDPGLVGGQAGLVVDVVERHVPPAAQLDALVRRHSRGVPARGGHGHDHRLVVVQVVVPGRGVLSGQPARRRPRRRHRVDRLVQVEPLGEGQERPQPGQQELARHRVPLGHRVRIGGDGRRAARPVGPADGDRAAAFGRPVAVYLADQQHRRARPEPEVVPPTLLTTSGRCLGPET